MCGPKHVLVLTILLMLVSQQLQLLVLLESGCLCKWQVIVNRCQALVKLRFMWHLSKCVIL
jgi:hypothetical protein